MPEKDPQVSNLRCQQKRRSEYGLDTGLFADFICGYSINLFMALHWNNLLVITVDGVVGSFSEKMESVRFEVSH